MGGEDDEKKEVVPAPKEQEKASSPKKSRNPYLPGKGITELTQGEMNSIKYKLKRVRDPTKRLALALEWNEKKKSALNYGYFSTTQMLTV